MNYATLIETLRRSVVQVLSERGGGSGVVWDRGGVIVTNAHVAAGRYAEVVDAAGQRRNARIIRRDRERDLALLVVAGQDLEPAEIGDSDRLRAGQVAVALGMPGAVVGRYPLGWPGQQMGAGGSASGAGIFGRDSGRRGRIRDRDQYDDLS
jgi:S1-C subfamily serine protease